jgi:hypothetical protein
MAAHRDLIWPCCLTTTCSPGFLCTWFFAWTQVDLVNLFDNHRARFLPMPEGGWSMSEVNP